MNTSIYNALIKISMDLRVANILTIVKELHEIGHFSDKKYEETLLLINKTYADF